MSKNLSPREVGRIIRQGGESLVLPEAEAMTVDAWEKYREGEERGMVKRVARAAVDDVRRLVRDL